MSRQTSKKNKSHLSKITTPPSQHFLKAVLTSALMKLFFTIFKDKKINTNGSNSPVLT